MRKKAAAAGITMRKKAAAAGITMRKKVIVAGTTTTIMSIGIWPMWKPSSTVRT